MWHSPCSQRNHNTTNLNFKSNNFLITTNSGNGSFKNALKACKKEKQTILRLNFGRNTPPFKEEEKSQWYGWSTKIGRKIWGIQCNENQDNCFVLKCQREA